MSGSLVFFGTTVALHNSGQQPALKVFMANRFMSARDEPKDVISSEQNLCLDIDHNIAGGQVVFPVSTIDFPINDGGIAIGSVSNKQSLFGEILVGCISYIDPSDGWLFLDPKKRHTTGFVFEVKTKSSVAGMYGVIPIDKSTPGNQIVYTPSVIQEGTAN